LAAVIASPTLHGTVVDYGAAELVARRNCNRGPGETHELPGDRSIAQAPITELPHAITTPTLH
jgi:hypothetical protein